MKLLFVLFALFAVVFAEDSVKEKRGLHLHLGVGGFHGGYGYSSPSVVHHHVVPSYHSYHSSPVVHHHHLHHEPEVHHVHHHDYY